jgi:type II restriction enzyme
VRLLRGNIRTQKHINNNNVEAKIRQQLQLLRDKGFIEFAERGNYREVH